MKIISLLQPWATLVVIGAKKIETRSWNTKYRGPILIHASKKFDDKQFKICQTEPFYSVLSSLDNFYSKNIFECGLPTGAIIGRVEIISTDRTDYLRHNLLSLGNAVENENEMEFGDYSNGRFGWKLKDAIQFNNPFKAKGSLSLWEHNNLHEEEIICPECNQKQWATVEHTIPFATFIHDCKKCNYTIMESEWNKVEAIKK